MNATLLAADCLPRGGLVTVQAGSDPQAPSFHIRAPGPHARVTDDTAILASRTMGAAAAERATREVTLRLLISARDGRDREYTLHLAPGACTVERSPAAGADATVRSDSGTWTDVLLHGLSADAAVADGRMSVEGDRSALDDVVTAFPLLTDA